MHGVVLACTAGIFFKSHIQLLVKTVFYPPMLPDIIGYFPGGQIVEVQAEDVVTCLFLWLCIGLRYPVFNPN